MAFLWSPLLPTKAEPALASEAAAVRAHWDLSGQVGSREAEAALQNQSPGISGAASKALAMPNSGPVSQSGRKATTVEGRVAASISTPLAPKPEAPGHFCFGWEKVNEWVNEACFHWYLH